MKIALESNAGVNVIRGYEPGEVRIRDGRYTRSLIVSAKRIIDDWEPTAADQLRAAHLQQIVEQSPEVLILGTGDTQVFPQPATFMTLMDLGIGFEVMDNAAACRTYNILLGEDRQVALALIITTPRP